MFFGGKMKSKKFLKALAALAVGTVMAGSFAFAACDNSKDDEKTDPPVTTDHEHHYGNWQQGDASGHYKLCTDSDCTSADKGKVTEAHNTNGDDNACSVCGYKEGTVDPGPGPGPDQTTDSKTISVDFANVSSVSDGQAIGDTGFTAHGSGIKVNTQGGNKVIEFGGGVWASGAVGRALGFKAEKAGKVEVTVEYSQGNAGRYLDLITADGTVLAASVAQPTEANNKTVKSYTLVAYTTSDNVQLYIGSHTSGIYILKASVKNTWATDGSSLIPAVVESDVTISKVTTSYTLINESVEVSTSDVSSVAKDGGTSLEGYGWTVNMDLYKGNDKAESKTVTAIGNDYKIAYEATKEGATKISKDIPVTVAYPTAITTDKASGIKEMLPNAETQSYTLNASDIKIMAGEVELNPANWTITYALDSDEYASASSWNLAAGSHTLKIKAVRDSATLETSVNIVIEAFNADKPSDVSVNVGTLVSNGTLTVNSSATSTTATLGEGIELKGSVKINADGQTIGGTAFTHRIVLKSTSDDNYIKITTKAAATIKIYARNSSSGGRELGLYDSGKKDSNLIDNLKSSLDSEKAVVEFAVSASGDYYLRSITNELSIYAIEIVY